MMRGCRDSGREGKCSDQISAAQGSACSLDGTPYCEIFRGLYLFDRNALSAPEMRHHAAQAEFAAARVVIFPEADMDAHDIRFERCEVEVQKIPDLARLAVACRIDGDSHCCLAGKKCTWSAFRG